MTPEAHAHLLELLATKHVGRANGITGTALATEAGVHPRDLRNVVSALREQGLGVCAHPETGYFLAETPDELDLYCLKFLRARALHSLKLVSRLTNTAMPVLVGQLLMES